VVIGFGGYVAARLPGRPRARGAVPIVIHEANARAGIANKVGARTPAGCWRRCPIAGWPPRWWECRCVRRSPPGSGGAARQARAHFGFADDAVVLLVFGGSQGARR
jgi:UDP-N-acetylglucosamine--N-acetylmuramyl-(pentapeptide) pyrophosphoryl-undecaprenol N-acetylglucosamine transferase